MRQGFVLLVFAVVLLASCGAASPPTDAIGIFKVDPPNQFQSPVDAANNDIRFLRNRGTDVVDEERAVNFKKLFDVKRRFGMKEKYVAVKNEALDFAKPTIANMLLDRNVRYKMYKQWDLDYKGP
ncbi:hypothetical protein GQ600_26316 [Phytophthora cactorum]|nr:hypothetical protein GQ600_26316 [Phytophthora cactorum]